MAETWPDGAIAYRVPAPTSENAEQWKEALDAAIKGKSIDLIHDGGDYYNLVGKCPRCGHEMGQSLEWTIYAPSYDAFGVLVEVPMRGKRSAPLRGAEADFEVVCSCDGKHQPHADGNSGCGWGRGLTVKLARP